MLEITQDQIENAVKHRHHLHQHPELGLETKETAAYIKDVLTRLGLAVHDIGVNSVLAVVDGEQTGATTLLRADTDALPIQEANQFAHRSCFEGKMHACGHDGHTASLLLAAAGLAQRPPAKGRAVLLFQSGEEGHGGAQQVIDDGLFQRFSIDRVFGFHNWPGVRAGAAVVHADYCMASQDTWNVELYTKGAHAAMPHQGVEPFAAVSALIDGLQKMPARIVDARDSAVFSITQVHGGTASNIIPEQIWLQGTARTFKPEVRDSIEAQATALCEGLAKAYAIDVRLNYQRMLPALRNSLPENAREAAQRVVGVENVLFDVPPCMASEDFALYLQHRPGCYIWFGNGEQSAPVHTPHYDFNDELLPLGARWYLALLEQHDEAGSALT